MDSLPFTRFKAGPYSWKIRWCKTEKSFQRAWSQNNFPDDYVPAHAFIDETAHIVYMNGESIGSNVELLVHTLFHELEHVVLLALGITQDDHDEIEVDRRSGILAQIFLTGK